MPSRRPGTPSVGPGFASAPGPKWPWRLRPSWSPVRSPAAWWPRRTRRSPPSSSSPCDAAGRSRPAGALADRTAPRPSPMRCWTRARRRARCGGGRPGRRATGSINWPGSFSINRGMEDRWCWWVRVVAGLAYLVWTDPMPAARRSMTTTLLALLAAVVAVAAAVRSTWSPCGLSVLSSITPFGESSRGHRYGVTAGWFVAGAVAGGATLGAVAAGLAAGVSTLDLGRHPAWVAGSGSAALVGAAAAVDAGLFGAVIPVWRRQLNDAWMSRYRGWVYGAGYRLAARRRDGHLHHDRRGVRGSCAGCARRSPGDGAGHLHALRRGARAGRAPHGPSQFTTELRALHHRFADWGPPVRLAVIGVELAVVVTALAAQWSLAGGAVALAAVAALVGVGSMGVRSPIGARRGLPTSPP